MFSNRGVSNDVEGLAVHVRTIKWTRSVGTGVVSRGNYLTNSGGGVDSRQRRCIELSRRRSRVRRRGKERSHSHHQLRRCRGSRRWGNRWETGVYGSGKV